MDTFPEAEYEGGGDEQGFGQEEGDWVWNQMLEHIGKQVAIRTFEGDLISGTLVGAEDGMTCVQDEAGNRWFFTPDCFAYFCLVGKANVRSKTSFFNHMN